MTRREVQGLSAFFYLTAIVVGATTLHSNSVDVFLSFVMEYFVISFILLGMWTFGKSQRMS